MAGAKQVLDTGEPQILVIGSSGAGKSTLCNALVNGNTDKNSLIQPCVTSSKASGVTSKIITFCGEGRLITDTIGFDDNRYTPDDVAEELRSMIRLSDIGFEKIILCIKYGRLTKPSRLCLKLLDAVFEKPERNMILYISGCEDGSSVQEFVKENEGDEDIDTLLGKLKSGAIVCGSFMVHRNVSVDNRCYSTLRKDTLQNIMRLIDTKSDCVIKARPPAEWGPYIKEIFQWYFNWTWSCFQETHIDVNYHYGTCRLCSSDRLDIKWAMLKECQHKFHVECLEKLPKDHMKCPRDSCVKNRKKTKLLPFSNVEKNKKE